MDVVLVGLSLPGVENHAIGALRTALRSADIEEAFVPFAGFSALERNLNDVLSRCPRVVGVSLQTIESALAVIVFTKLLRRRGFRGRIVLGGHFATLNASELLEAGAGIDAVVRFAGEEALVAIAEGALDNAERRRRIPGVVFRDEHGVTQHGAPPRWTSPTVLARAARFEPLPEHLGFVAADLVASRGCESHCGYCCIAAASDLARKETGDPGAIYERRPMESLAEEIANLHHERGARVFNFMDDNVLPREPSEVEEWARRLRALLDAKRVGALAISLQVRADAVSEGSARELARLGLARAYVGVDGYSPSQLRALGRRADSSAGVRAIQELSRNGIFTVVNALLVGPTIPFSSVLNEIEGLARLEHAPVHLLPIEVRAGTTYFRAAARRGLVEGGLLGWHYRFADVRTERMAEIITSFPTRLAERSVPIALYDLGYNLGIARRLLPELDITAQAATFARVTAAWNTDQLRVLRGAAAVAAASDQDAPKTFIDEEMPRVTRLDRLLIADADTAMTELERMVSRMRRRRVSAHARGRLLGSVAFSMSVAACGGTVQDSQPSPAGVGSDARAGMNGNATGGASGNMGVSSGGASRGGTSAGGGGVIFGAGGSAASGGTSVDASASSCSDPSRTPVDPPPNGDYRLGDRCSCSVFYQITFDAEGRAIGFAYEDGAAPSPEVDACLKESSPSIATLRSPVRRRHLDRIVGSHEMDGAIHGDGLAVRSVGFAGSRNGLQRGREREQRASWGWRSLFA
jgi:anaerobic magnesium-protoporphyrin IX monomethyl ester cyclase